ncbi:MAG TPA: L-threonylcarbamoyladenylate synthase, partial [Peptostreptococcaceae bacterium]|nr:L-threonylcarbamoyladenylate synthase [Peptostreptococcaceae bacterium]
MKNTILSNIDKENIDIDEIKKHANLLKQGATVIFPTETVYGLGANALDERATAKIYEAKGRPSDNPLIVHISEKKDLYELANNISEKAEVVMDKFWPGPLTIIFQKKDIIPNITSGGLNTVAIRMPSHPIAISLIKESGVPIAAPSANISGRPSPTEEKHVYEEMNGRVDGIILGGDCNYGLESTVLDLTSDIPMILRPGSITQEDLEEYLGRVDIDPALIKKEDNIVAKAPGMKYTHYSPEADVYIVYVNKENTINKINYLINENNKNGLKCGVMCMTPHTNRYNGEVIALGDNLEEVGYNLFKA